MRSRSHMGMLLPAMALGALMAAGPVRPETPEEREEREARRAARDQQRREMTAENDAINRAATEWPGRKPHPLDAERQLWAAQRRIAKAARRAAAWNGAR